MPGAPCSTPTGCSTRPTSPTRCSITSGRRSAATRSAPCVAEQDGAVIGFAHVRTHTATFTIGEDWYLEDLFVDPSARAGGVGTAIIEHIVEDRPPRRRRHVAVGHRRHQRCRAERLRQDREAHHVGHLRDRTRRYELSLGSSASGTFRPLRRAASVSRGTPRVRPASPAAPLHRTHRPRPVGSSDRSRDASSPAPRATAGPSASPSH